MTAERNLIRQDTSDQLTRDIAEPMATARNTYSILGRPSPRARIAGTRVLHDAPALASEGGCHLSVPAEGVERGSKEFETGAF